MSRRTNWLSRFHLHRRSVSDYRHGRCFVTGIAAHVYSPATAPSGAPSASTTLSSAGFGLWPSAAPDAYEPVEFTSQLYIRYRSSDIFGIARGFAGYVKGGDRLVDAQIRGPVGEKWLLELLIPTSHQLVLFSGIDAAKARKDDLHWAE
ncbi:Uu.00g143000.m01.CDS01 [Anthostomella pinea]|uniref:Uu.00g143000.m01.CDS01 n=1 Tax=Anthostomella pinea TaxID=933095 RepID=A0AAI8YLN2_9PEZI|nr:Uu.00g143000.m01.CDS01 [Anthostomella pinea]